MTQTLSNLPMRAQSYDDPFIEALYKGSETSDTIDRLETIRPWGSYRRIDIGYRYQVKQITVSPGARLSLQKHHHRAEHWIVVRGTAEVTCDDVVKFVNENESVYLPLGSVHRLANPGKIDIELRGASLRGAAGSGRRCRRLRCLGRTNRKAR